MSEQLRTLAVNPHRTVDYPPGIIGVHGTGDRGMRALRETSILPGQTTVEIVGVPGDIFFYGNPQAFSEGEMYDYRDARLHAETYAAMNASFDALTAQLGVPEDEELKHAFHRILEIDVGDLTRNLRGQTVAQAGVEALRAYLEDNYFDSMDKSFDAIMYLGHTAYDLLGYIREAQQHKGHLLLIDNKARELPIEPDTFEYGGLVVHTNGRGLSADYLWQPIAETRRW